MSLRDELTTLLNQHSAENESGTPDRVLADFLVDSLDAFDSATNARDTWWGFEPKIGGTIPAKGSLPVELDEGPQDTPEEPVDPYAWTKELPELPEGVGRYDHLSDFDYLDYAYSEEGGKCLDCGCEPKQCHKECAPFCIYCDHRTKERSCPYCSEPMLDPNWDPRVPKSQQKYASVED